MTAKTQVSDGRSAMRLAASREEERALAHFLEAHASADVVEFDPKDDDRMDDALCSGRFECAIFSGLDALLTAVWEGHAHVDRWLDAGVRIELASCPIEDAAACRTVVAGVYESLARWRRRQRRRQIIAAAILSGLALAALAVLFQVMPGIQ